MVYHWVPYHHDVISSEVWKLADPAKSGATFHKRLLTCLQLFPFASRIAMNSHGSHANVSKLKSKNSSIIFDMNSDQHALLCCK